MKLHYVLPNRLARWLLIGCLAAVFPAYADWKGNWLIGAGRELAERKGHLLANMNYSNVLADLSEEMTDRGYVWDVFAGYQIKCRDWIFGAEVNYKWEDINEEHHMSYSDFGGLFTWQGVVEYQSKPTFGLTGRLGYEMAPFFISYIRLGVESSKDKLTTTYILNPGPSAATASLVDESWHTHFIGGFGAEIPLPKIKSLAVRLEYDYHCYFSDKGLATNGVLQSGAAKVNFTSETHPITQSGKIALVWNFA